MVGQEQARNEQGAHQEWARSAPGVGRSIPGVGQERPRNRLGAHQDWWARFMGSGARQGFPAKSCFSRGCKTLLFFSYWESHPFLFSGLWDSFWVQVVGAGVSRERTRSKQKRSGVGQEQPGHWAGVR